MWLFGVSLYQVARTLPRGKGHKPYGKQSGWQLGLRMGRKSCEAVGGIIRSHLEGQLGIIGQHRRLLWSTPEDFLPLKSTQKSKAQYPTIVVPSAEHLWSIPLAPKYLPYCRKSPHTIALPGISPNTLHLCKIFVLFLNLFFFKFKSHWETEVSIYTLEGICLLPLVA